MSQLHQSQRGTPAVYHQPLLPRPLWVVCLARNWPPVRPVPPQESVLQWKTKQCTLQFLSVMPDPIFCSIISAKSVVSNLKKKSLWCDSGSTKYTENVLFRMSYLPMAHSISAASCLAATSSSVTFGGDGSCAVSSVWVGAVWNWGPCWDDEVCWDLSCDFGTPLALGDWDGCCASAVFCVLG